MLRILINNATQELATEVTTLLKRHNVETFSVKNIVQRVKADTREKIISLIRRKVYISQSEILRRLWREGDTTILGNILMKLQGEGLIECMLESDNRTRVYKLSTIENNTRLEASPSSMETPSDHL